MDLEGVWITRPEHKRAPALRRKMATTSEQKFRKTQTQFLQDVLGEQKNEVVKTKRTAIKAKKEPKPCNQKPLSFGPTTMAGRTSQKVFSSTPNPLPSSIQ